MTRKRFTDLFPKDLTYNLKSRNKKASKIVAVLKDDLGDLSKLSCLDLGSSVGLITMYFGKHFKTVVGVDVDNNAIKNARKNNKLKNVSFKLSTENKLPFKSQIFDVVVFNQVYEHVENPERLMGEVRRILKKGGVCFFGARNKYGGPYDGHYLKAPFISWFPKYIANKYISLVANKKEYDINLYSLDKLNELVRRFEKRDYTLKIIKNPVKYSADDAVPTQYGLNKILLLTFRVFYIFMPNYIWILQKR